MDWGSKKTDMVVANLAEEKALNRVNGHWREMIHGAQTKKIGIQALGHCCFCYWC